jgi:hypothetical protein
MEVTSSIVYRLSLVYVSRYPLLLYSYGFLIYVDYLIYNIPKLHFNTDMPLICDKKETGRPNSTQKNSSLMANIKSELLLSI